MRKRLVRLYREARKAGVACIVGESARVSLDIARTVERFEALEDDFVRIRDEPEHDPDFSHLDTWGHLSEQSKERHIDSALQLGVVRIIGEYRTSEDGEWIPADSIGDNQGYERPVDWRENAYVADVMSQTLSALREALKARFCSKCGARAA